MANETLFSAQTANGDGAEVQIAPEKGYDYISRTLIVTGTLDGGTFSLKLHDGTAYAIVSDAQTTTTPFIKNVEFRSFEGQVRGNVAGGGASLNINAVLV